jgi:hypothetical protein
MKSVESEANKNTTPNGVEQDLQSTYTQIIYQIVFSTKNREKALSKDNRPKLFEYVSGVLRITNAICTV